MQTAPDHPTPVCSVPGHVLDTREEIERERKARSCPQLLSMKGLQIRKLNLTAWDRVGSAAGAQRGHTREQPQMQSREGFLEGDNRAEI